jgi:hypothetical protein
MQHRAEELGIAASPMSSTTWAEFLSYLHDRGLTLKDFEKGIFAKYKQNADLQLPAFVDRLATKFPGATLAFEDVEKEYRNLGRKGDFLVTVGGSSGPPIAVSLKNYIGSGGVTRPQVGSGTFASFAASFIFDRVGPGKYIDPRDPPATFQGKNVAVREAVLRHMGRNDLIKPLAVLDRLQAEVRDEFLGPDCEYYDKARVKAAAKRVAEEGIETVLDVFRLVGIDTIRERFLSRIGLDGKEEALFFDSERYVDSITNWRYHDKRQQLNADETTFTVGQHLQGIRFAFAQGATSLLTTHVPFTINTNGAWYRPNPKTPYKGTRTYNDKGYRVQLYWGQRRPHKSKEIATSINTYVDLAKVGIFGD